MPSCALFNGLLLDFCETLYHLQLAPPLLSQLPMLLHQRTSVLKDYIRSGWSHCNYCTTMKVPERYSRIELKMNEIA